MKFVYIIAKHRKINNTLRLIYYEILREGFSMHSLATVSEFPRLESSKKKDRNFLEKGRKFLIKSNNNNNNIIRYTPINKDEDMFKDYLESLSKDHVESMEISKAGKVGSMERLDIKQAADYLGVTDKTIRNYIKQGLPWEWGPGKTGGKKYVTVANLEAWKRGEIPSLEPGNEEPERVESSKQSMENSMENSMESIETETVTLEPAQEGTKYLIDVWAEVDRRIAQAVQPYMEKVDKLEAQNKVLLERLKAVEEHGNKVDEFITEWREDKRKKENRTFWARFKWWR
jgi:hypothetical protein